MTRRTEDLIRELARSPAPVAPLPPLRKVAIAVVAAGALSVVVAALLASLTGLLSLRLPSGMTSVAIAAHLVLAAGALAVALASCVPGREAVEDAGLWLAAIGGGATVGLALMLSRLVAFELPAPVFAADLTVCTLLAVLPALVPAMLLARFALAGAPARPGRTLAFASLATLGLATLPGHVGCALGGPLHAMLGHVLAPGIGGAVVFVSLAILYRRANAGRVNVAV